MENGSGGRFLYIPAGELLEPRGRITDKTKQIKQLHQQIYVRDKHLYPVKTASQLPPADTGMVCTVDMSCMVEAQRKRKAEKRPIA